MKRWLLLLWLMPVAKYFGRCHICGKSEAFHRIGFTCMDFWPKMKELL